MNAIRAVCDAHKVPLPAAALQFPLAHPAVAAIIPGPRPAAEFEENVKLIRQPIPSALWAELRDKQLLHPEAPTPSLKAITRAACWVSLRLPIRTIDTVTAQSVRYR